MTDQKTHSPLLNREQAARYLLLTDPDATGVSGLCPPGTTTPAPRLLTTRKLAAYLGVAEQTIRNHAADIPGRKRFGAGKRGGRVLYDRETIDRWIEKNNGVTDMWLDGRRMME